MTRQSGQDSGDTATGGDEDVAIVEGIIEVRQAPIRSA